MSLQPYSAYCIRDTVAMSTKSVTGTQTEYNLLNSFARKCQARQRYEMFAKVAKKEGYEQISAIFQKTADQEKWHAKRFFRFLESGADTEITATYRAGVVGDTAANLREAAGGEYQEWTTLYPQFAQTAQEEGFREIAVAYRLIAKCEESHERRFKALLDNVESGSVFEKEEEVYWECRVCGHIHHGKKAPTTCATCSHPQAYFELRVDNF
ncbi:hypothetical protein KIPB_002569 [Kipferlia bialata]|uniref:Rubrerythrin n=1 Tax=Kipferlia bialata TaxID=797122 RepID=A0A9K3CSM3_9EUKA|nr:hypothetical protein KIPB_002569 [Kipferlia bialata]|eukprot:g2569.t1